MHHIPAWYGWNEVKRAMLTTRRTIPDNGCPRCAKKENNAFAATVDGRGPVANYLLGEWILCADWNPAAYRLVAGAAVASGRASGNASLTAHVLWMKHRRAAAVQ